MEYQVTFIIIIMMIFLKHHHHQGNDNPPFDPHNDLDAQAVDTGLQWKSIKGKGEIEACLAGQCLCQVNIIIKQL